MKNIIGSPVYGRDFLFRDKQLKMGLRLLQNGNSFLMLGIRRTGKSSYLRQVAYSVKEANSSNVAIQIDCSTYQSALDFYRGLYESMPKSMKVRFKKALADSRQLPKKIIDFITDIVESIGIAEVNIDFKDKLMAYNKTFEDLVGNFFTAKDNENVFLFIDELPFFFENISKNDGKTQEIQMLLTSLRSWRDAGIPMGITGSLNLHQQLEHLGLSRKLLAGLNTITLKPFTKEEAKTLFKTLLTGKECEWWNDEISERLLTLVPDYVPYFLQYAFHTVMVHECKTPEQVEEAYHNDVIPGLFADFIYQFEERLKSFEGEELNAAMLLLDRIAKNESTTLDDLQKVAGSDFNYKVLIRLVDYEFLTLSGKQQYNFTLNIIKNWWQDKRNL